MKVQNITDVDKFFEVIDSCKGKVELVTGEGDRLNLKSKLSQYVSMANIFSDGTIAELELLAYEPEDIQKLLRKIYSAVLYIFLFPLEPKVSSGLIEPRSLSRTILVKALEK